MPVLTIDQDKALLATCGGKTFDELRDQAIASTWHPTAVARAIRSLALDQEANATGLYA